MRIESGLYPGQRNQMFIVLAVFAGFALWFARDGWLKYPAENLKWAQQQLPTRVEGLQTNPQAMMANLSEVKPDMPEEQLRSLLGEPALVHEGTHWYVGPAAYAGYRVSGGKVAQVVKIEENRNHSESSIKWQKYIAIALGIGLLYYLINMIRTFKTRYVVDDDGLQVGSQRIAWDEMTGLDSSQFAKKDRVTLTYNQGGATRSVVLRSSHIDRFAPIVQTICERKGFTSPFAKPGSKPTSES